jgi:hypothetical protein
VVREQDRELSHSDGRRAGDCLIALEAAGSVTHAIFSNARTWEPLCQNVGVAFVKISFPVAKKAADYLDGKAVELADLKAGMRVSEMVYSSFWQAVVEMNVRSR